MEASLRKWIEDVTKYEFSKNHSFLGNLKDGTKLCQLMTKIQGKFLLFNRQTKDIEELESVSFLFFSPLKFP